MILDSAVKFAAHTGDAKVVALKKHLVGKIIAAQEADGLSQNQPWKRQKDLNVMF